MRVGGLGFALPPIDETPDTGGISITTLLLGMTIAALFFSMIGNSGGTRRRR